MSMILNPYTFVSDGGSATADPFTLVGHSSHIYNSTSVTKPAGTQEGDVVFIQRGEHVDTNTTLPTGGSPFTTLASVGNVVLFGKVAGPVEPAAWGIPGGSTGLVITCVVLRPPASAGTVELSAVTNVGTAQDNTLKVPSLTPADGDGLVFFGKGRGGTDDQAIIAGSEGTRDDFVNAGYANAQGGGITWCRSAFAQATGLATGILGPELNGSTPADSIAIMGVAHVSEPPADWSPTSEASLVGWWDAAESYGGLTDGDILAADWADKSGNGYDLTPGFTGGSVGLSAPQYDDAVFPNGASYQVSASGEVAHGLAGGVPFAAGDDVMYAAVFHVESWRGSNPGLWRDGSSSTGGNFMIFQGATGRPWVRWAGTDILKPSTGAGLEAGNTYVVVFRVRSGTDVDMWVNGALEYSGTHSKATTAGAIHYFFGQDGVNEYPVGPYAEHMLFAGAGDTPDPADVNDYLIAKYGIGGFDVLNDINWHAAFWASDPGWTDPGDGNPVSQWDDGSGNARHAAQATGSAQPTFQSSVAALNNQPAVEFNDDLLATAAWTGLSQPNTIVMVGITDAGSVWIHDGLSFGGRHVLYLPFGDWVMYAGGNGPSVAGDFDPHLFVEYYNGASSTLEVDGIAGTTANPSSEGLGGLTIGNSRDGGSTGLVGYIAFIGVYDGTLSAGELSNIKTWAADTYGLSIS